MSEREKQLEESILSKEVEEEELYSVAGGGCGSSRSKLESEAESREKLRRCSRLDLAGADVRCAGTFSAGDPCFSNDICTIWSNHYPGASPRDPYDPERCLTIDVGYLPY